MSVRLYLGAIFGGPEMKESAVYSAKNKILNCADKLGRCTDNDSIAGIDYVLHVEGRLFHLDWEGVRDARFSRKRKLLMIQIAVPERFVSSETVGAYICEGMRIGVAEAKPIFEKAGIPFDAEAFTKFIDDIERELCWRK